MTMTYPFSVIAIVILIVSGCSHATKPTRGIAGLEDFLTCSISQEAEAFLRSLNSGTTFKIDEENDHFYLPVGNQYAFGFEITYLGPYGRMDATGPNVGLRGSRSAVVEALRSQRGIELQCDDEGCYREISEALGIVVLVPPEAPSTAVVMCAEAAM